MQVAKLREREEHGLVPAGRYFERLAANLRAAPAAKRREDEERHPPPGRAAHRQRAALA